MTERCKECGVVYWLRGDLCVSCYVKTSAWAKEREMQTKMRIAWEERDDKNPRRQLWMK